jgi:uncharacterized protein YoxC
MIAEAGAWLLQSALAAGDTVFTKSVATERDWFDTLTSLASIVISIALIALTVGLLPAAWNSRKSYKKFNDLLDRVYGDINPLVRHAHNVTDNLDYITTSIRVDLQLVNQTIATANDRLLEAVKQTEQRMKEFNALVDVVQREAEDVFVSTASAARGVRAGVVTFREEALAEEELREELRARQRLLMAEDDISAAFESEDDEADEDDLDEDPLQASLALDDDDDDEDVDTHIDTTLGELNDGHSSSATAGRGEERPRIRPRRRGARGDRA